MLIEVERARQLCNAVFVEKLRTPDHIAEVATDVLVEANLRGIDSHGIGVLPYYLDKVSAGQIAPSAEPRLVSETPTTAVFDGRQSLGHFSSRLAMGAAVERAAAMGLGAAVVRQGTHNGAISEYTIQAARAGMIGIAATACAPHVAPHGGTSGMHGTNPISYAFPRGDSDPVVFDLSTGRSSAKLKEEAERSGVLTVGQALDRSGNPTTDPADLPPKGWILPVAGHLGFGLGILVDGLTAALADSPIGREIPLVDETDGPYHGAFFAMALSPTAFAGADGFKTRIESLVSQIESHRPSDPDQPVRWPGQRGWAERRKRIVEGIPFTTTQWRMLLDELSASGVNVKWGER